MLQQQRMEALLRSPLHSRLPQQLPEPPLSSPLPQQQPYSDGSNPVMAAVQMRKRELGNLEALVASRGGLTCYPGSGSLVPPTITLVRPIGCGAHGRCARGQCALVVGCCVRAAHHVSWVLPLPQQYADAVWLAPCKG